MLVNTVELKLLHPQTESDSFRPSCGDDAQGPQLSPEIVERLGWLLREFYAELLSQPIPEHLTRLLDGFDRNGKPDNGR